MPSPGPATTMPSPQPATTMPSPGHATTMPSPGPATTIPSPQPATTMPSPQPATTMPSPQPTTSKPTVEPVITRRVEYELEIDGMDEDTFDSEKDQITKAVADTHNVHFSRVTVSVKKASSRRRHLADLTLVVAIEASEAEAGDIEESMNSS